MIEEQKKSWTAKLLNDEELLCSKIVEEARELCKTLTEAEGKERTAEEMADVLYHCMVLLNKQVIVYHFDELNFLKEVPFEDVLTILRRRFGTSGIEEKLSRKQK